MNHSTAKLPKKKLPKKKLPKKKPPNKVQDDPDMAFFVIELRLAGI